MLCLAIMARGTRAPSQTAYQGSVGRTHTEIVHVSGPRGELIAATVHVSIDAVSDPELAERLHAGALNVVTVDGGELRIAVPVLYHDPAAEVLVLVLGDAHRHRELDERIRIYERLRAEPAPIPAYAKEFAVVFGAAGLRAYLEQRAEQAVGEKALERKARELTRQAEELVRARAEVERARAEAERSRAEAERSRGDAERARQDAERAAERLEAQRRALDERSKEPQLAEATTIGPPPSAAPPEREEHLSTQPTDRHAELAEDLKTELVAGLPAPAAPAVAPAAARPAAQIRVETDEEPTATAIVPPGADPLTTETVELPVEPDPWLDFAATGATSSFHVQDGAVRLALVAGEQLARGLGGKLDLRVLLHRVNTYPVVTLLIGPPAALRVASKPQIAVIALDIGTELDRQVLSALARRFELAVDIVVRGRPIRRIRLSAPLAENVGYILRAADDHLRGIAADGEAEASFPRARDLVLGAGYDLLGLEHAEYAEFRDDRLAQLGTAQAVRRAIAIARRFARPSREDYLVTARGFPLVRWHELRRHVIESAVAWGLWMGAELAQIAVSEGLARSRRDLVLRLEAGGEVLRHHPTANDLDPDADEDNRKAIAEEARALGVELRKKPQNGAIKSEDVSTVSGSIERTPTSAVPRARSLDELLALLDDKQQRVTAAAELCDRGEARAAAPVIAAVKKMSRAEAVRILGKSVKFGAAAAGPLREGLRSSKAFLRHGCALALGLLRDEEGTHAVIELLLEEPTEIWREIARAIGQIGPTALMPLASHVGRMGERMTPQLAERAAWAMAHVGARGGRAALEQMAAGQSLLAPIAKQALGLVENAARDEVRVQPGEPGREVTVNRAFSRRFFEALEADRPEAAQAALHDLEMSGPLELEDGDLISLDEEEAELDEADLIQP